MHYRPIWLILFACLYGIVPNSESLGQGAGTWNERGSTTSVPQVSTSWARTQAHLILMGSMGQPAYPGAGTQQPNFCPPAISPMSSREFQKAYEMMAAANALSVAGRFDLQGQWLGFPSDPNNAGQCATGVQFVYAMAGYSLGHTCTWKRGSKVTSGAVPSGAAIAYFPNGKNYRGGHAAIYAYPTRDGIVVYDQYRTGNGKAWGTRTIKRGGKGKKNADNYYMVSH